MSDVAFRRKEIGLPGRLGITESKVTELRCGDFAAKVTEGHGTAEVHSGSLHFNPTAEDAAELAMFFNRIASLLGYVPTRG